MGVQNARSAPPIPKAPSANYYEDAQEFPASKFKMASNKMPWSVAF
jgi:hypothetical protein